MLEEFFDKPSFDSRFSWLNEPESWWVDSEKEVLIIEPNQETDFWQKTRYGFENDNGHFLYTEVMDDFMLEARLSLNFQNQYDQAGLMIRLSSDFWLKTSIEHEQEDEDKLGVVVTRDGFSDWSSQEYSGRLKDISFRIEKEGPDFLVYFKEMPESGWTQLRMTHLKESDSINCGLYACSPVGSGFSARFDYLKISRI